MRIPWGAPTVSDATKLGLCSIWELPSITTAGSRLYKLLYQLVMSETFANLDAFDVTQTGVGYCTVSGGILSINGDGTAHHNGCVHKTGVSRGEGYLEFEILSRYGTSITEYLGLHSASALAAPDQCYGNRPSTSTDMYCGFPTNGANVGRTPVAGTPGTWYTIRLYILKDTGDNFRRVRFSIEGGTEWPSETVIGVSHGSPAFNFAATLYPIFNRTTNSAANDTQIRNLKWYSGYATDGPTLTYVADAGAGKTFDGFVPTSLAAIGSWATTNAKFQYSFDDGTPSYNGSWLTLAELNALSASTERHRYIRLQVQVNSDGSTQQYAGELNADDGTAGSGDFPATSSVLTSDTVQGSAGTFDEAARNTDPGEANVLTGTSYKIQNVDKNGSFDEAARNSFDGTGADIRATKSLKLLNVDYVSSLQQAHIIEAGSGTYHEAETGEVELGVNFGPASAYTGTLPPGANCDLDLSGQVSGSTVISAALGSTFTFVGGITAAADVSAADVTLAVYDDAACTSLVETLIAAGSADLVATVQKTWAAIAGAAVTWEPSSTGRYWVKASVSGGSPDVGTLDYIQQLLVTFIATRPGLVVADDGDGSVTVTVTNNAGQTSRLKYQHSSESTWTTHGSSLTGNGTIDDLTGLQYGTGAGYYDFVMVPYDSATEMEAEPSNVERLHLEDSSAAETSSELDDQLEEQLTEILAELGRTVTYNPDGGTPAEVTAIVHLEAEAFMERPDIDEVIYRGWLRLQRSDVTDRSIHDTFTIDSVTWAVKDFGPVGHSFLQANLERRVARRVAAVGTRRGGG